MENFTGFTTLHILAENHKMMTEAKHGPDIAWREKGNEAMCIANSDIVAEFCEKIRARTLVVPWTWIRKEVERNSHVQTDWKMGSSR